MTPNTIRVTVEGYTGYGATTVAKIVAIALSSTPGCEIVLQIDGFTLAPRDVHVSEEQGARVLAAKKIEISVVPVNRAVGG